MRMYYWNIYLNGIVLTSEMKSFINMIKVKYEINKPTVGSISVQSNSFLESVFTEGQKVKVEMGYYRHELITMIDGEIIKTPEGSGEEYITYTVDIAEKAVSMSREAKIINPKIPKKNVIITELILRNGYTPVVDITDIGTIPVSELPIQNNKTDLEYLTECAEKWNCVYWIDQDIGTIYFMDSDKAHIYGSLNKKINPADIALDYIIGYRTNILTNNVSKVSWKISNSQGSSDARNLTKDGPAPSIPSVPTEVELEGVTYTLKPEIYDEVVKNPSFALKLISIFTAQETNTALMESVKKYYVQYPAGGSSLNKSKQERPGYKKLGVELTLDLNQADFYLRPPRTALFKAGSPNPKMKTSYLPSYVAGETPRKYNINIVETSIDGNYPKTSLVATI